MNKLSLLCHYFNARYQFTRWSCRSDLLAWQDRRVQAHLKWVNQHSPLYAQHWQDHDLRAWSELPTVDKALLMGNFDQWNTRNLRLQDAVQVAERAERSRDFSPSLQGITVGLSSGTSGNRGIFLASDAERARWAGTLLARVLQGTLHQTHRAALFLRADSSLYRSIGSRRFRFEFFDLLQPMEEHLPRLHQLNPTILAAPPSVLSQLAEQPDAAALLAPPHLLLSVADVLGPSDAARISQAFQQPLGQLYQATEGFLAATCPHGTLHWNEDVIVLQKEWLDPDKTRYTPIITDFRRSTQPIVRFRLNDIILPAATTHRCPCGSHFETIGRIEGRQDDVLFLRRLDGKGWVRVYPDFVRRLLLLAIADPIDYTIVQTSPDEWQIQISGHSEPTHHYGLQREVHTLCHQLNAVVPRLQFVPFQPPPLHEKRRRVRRLIPGPP